MPSPYAAQRAFVTARKQIERSWRGWSFAECAEVALALDPLVKFRAALLSKASEEKRMFVSVTAAARLLKMHRASVHRYLQRHPEVRNSRGKVILPRLVDVISRAKDIETRGRRTILRAPRPRLNNLPPHLRPFRSALSEYHAWRRELGAAWAKWSRGVGLEIAEEFAPVADFVAQLNARALRLMQAQAAEAPAA